MWRPRVRFTVRRMMIAVAIDSGSDSAAEATRKRWFYLDQARHYAREGRRHRELAQQRTAEGQFNLATTEGLVADWAEHLSDNYRKAAIRPWAQPPSGHRACRVIRQSFDDRITVSDEL